ncbi:3-deoxy-7-phosphoheptulonate synthase [Sporolactobacillus terrae]|uniref:3-deoxy-7-phosphoheptulonate synthase n=1 Tax=Sporolactobacillus terrae TaxID=269673 RepID=A0ABX5Q843_9BACL|nr:3-deoxy-7-phosphoheptulonate synthase [Sporolactobacillus terrae]QAA22818.1 3-deoxy-7-phosphoheptulonate synthase [Sporolactobacillus terrae]QAA25792.1 3-deoxy-7-phosphoheptulonate synthase [Sporolactobacillus terrae]UAK17670.1 3-deoxy-7-phosphoheptulonate synthase [Sporolactobacillus terrae]
MIITFKQTVTPETQHAFQTKFNQLHKQVFIFGLHMAVVGLDHYSFSDQEAEAIDQIIAETPSFVQASRSFHPEDSVIQLPHSEIGTKTFTIMAGPCSVESEDHIRRMAEVARRGGASILRGGAFKPRTSPYSFQGLGEEGLRYLRKAADENGMDVITEVMDETHVPLVAEYTDVMQIGARNMQNFSLLKAVGKTRIPVALKRGMAASIDDLLNASEYIASGGNTNIILIERGIRTFDHQYTRNTFDVAAVPVLQKLTHYPVIVDPSHAVGCWDLVAPAAYAGTAAGASGMIVEIHDHPEKAMSDGPQALKSDTYLTMTKRVAALRQCMATWED